MSSLTRIKAEFCLVTPGGNAHLEKTVRRTGLSAHRDLHPGKGASTSVHSTVSEALVQGLERGLSY